jgi:hypothetical protein
MDRAREEKDKCELKGRTLDARERFDRDKAHSERRGAAFNTLDAKHKAKDAKLVDAYLKDADAIKKRGPTPGGRPVKQRPEPAIRMPLLGTRLVSRSSKHWSPCTTNSPGFATMPTMTSRETGAKMQALKEPIQYDISSWWRTRTRTLDPLIKSARFLLP